MRDWRIAGTADPALDDAHPVVPEHERADALWSAEEAGERNFFACADRTAAHTGRQRIHLSALRADDSASSDLRHHRAHEGHREGADTAGGTSAKVAG